MSDKKDTWCVLPWIHMCVRPNNTLKPCCRYNSNSPSEEFNTNLDRVYQLGEDALNDASFKVIRKKMLNNESLPGCKKCYIQEDATESVKRQSLRQYTNRRFSDIEKEKCTTDFLELQYLEMSIDNICNLQCKMCSSMFSSRLINRDKMLGNTVYKKLEPNFYKLNNVDLTKLTVVKILGGEPFITPNFEKFIDYLIERSNPSNITLEIATNGTVVPSSSIVKKLNTFKHICLFVSLDSYSTANDYQRYGSSFKEIFENAQKYEKLFDSNTLSFHVAITLLTANTLSNTLNFLTKNNNYHVSTDFVIDPDYLSLLHAPLTYVEWVLKCNNDNHSAYNLLLSFFEKTVYNEHYWNEFVKKIDMLDNYYGTKIEDYNIDLASYLDNFGYRKIKQ